MISPRESSITRISNVPIEDSVLLKSNTILSNSQPQGGNKIQSFKTNSKKYFELSYQKQRRQTGIEKKKNFAYNELPHNNDNSIENSDDSHIVQKEDFMRTFENNKHLKQTAKHIKTADTWKLDGNLKFNGQRS